MTETENKILTILVSSNKIKIKMEIYEIFKESKKCEIL
ncbi:MAG: hypothetical protein Lokiarch_47670 [Candidatus Lokiarchaeum sp. GC14_75]|nr:MAG: hypothetical protein Lokiarch_47670 [Candidatus Lokiarchaeum sp. GC14_75]